MYTVYICITPKRTQTPALWKLGSSSQWFQIQKNRKNKVDTTRTQTNSCNWLLPIPILNIMLKWLHWIWMDVPADNGSVGCSNGLNEIRKRDNNPVPCIWSIEAIPNVQNVGHHFCVLQLLDIRSTSCRNQSISHELIVEWSPIR
jgi:hypothetical protein